MSIAENAKQVYENELQVQLETDHWGDFVAVEPISKSYYLGHSFMEAAMAAKTAFPERKSFVLRVGHDAAFHLGASAT